MYVNPIHAIDFYKSGHIYQYPPGTQMVYSNITPRANTRGIKSKLTDGKVVVYGIQGFIQWFLIDCFNKEFFRRPLDSIIHEYKARMDTALGPGAVGTDHIVDLHKHGSLPLCILALPEGTRINPRVPYAVLYNTHPNFYWLTNYIESVFSAETWKMVNNATIAYEFRKLIQHWAIKTMGNADFVPWQGHDFSFRGMSGLYDAMACGSAHLTSFLGTDTVPALDYIDEYYPDENEFLGGSVVAATEHSVMCAGIAESNELDTFSRLLDIYPEGVVSIVSDTEDYWNVITNIIPQLKEKILARKPNALGLAKTVIRPDSGDPYKILVGDEAAPEGSPQRKGTIECLWDIFGGERNCLGYRTLHERIGTSYGDSITLELAERILEGLAAKGFSSANQVFGIGSYTYQYSTRDTYGQAIKATYCIVNGEGREIYKNPKTDSGVKASARGILQVRRDESGELVLVDRLPENEMWQGELKAVFMNGKLIHQQTFGEIRRRLWG